MANALYNLAKADLLDGSLDLIAGLDIMVSLVDEAYVPNLNTDAVVADLGANIVDTSTALGSKTNTLGVFDAANYTFVAVPADNPCNLVIHEDAGRLIAFIDTAAGGALPVTPVGDDIPIAWPVAGIFSL